MIERREGGDPARRCAEKTRTPLWMWGINSDYVDSREAFKAKVETLINRHLGCAATGQVERF